MGTSKQTYKIIFRIRRCYYDKIVAGTKTDEKRRNSEYWQKVLLNLNKYIERTRGIKDWLNTSPLIPFAAEVGNDAATFGIQAVFISGKGIKHVREITAIQRIKTPRETFSEQGKKDVDTALCLVFSLGDVVEESCQCGAPLDLNGHCPNDEQLTDSL
ncbi:MAG: hypothetical protein PHI29_13200 [Gallionella sp.]|nr:hypothetical protein [Gallionella sp.]